MKRSHIPVPAGCLIKLKFYETSLVVRSLVLSCPNHARFAGCMQTRSSQTPLKPRAPRFQVALPVWQRRDKRVE